MHLVEAYDEEAAAGAYDRWCLEILGTWDTYQLSSEFSMVVYFKHLRFKLFSRTPGPEYFNNIHWDSNYVFTIFQDVKLILLKQQDPVMIEEQKVGFLVAFI